MFNLDKFKGIFRDTSKHDLRHDELGQELLDPTPMALPVGFTRPPTLQEQVARLVRTEFSRHAVSTGRESFDEADDFDHPDNDPSSPYEQDFDIATVSASRSGFIEETPISRERADELRRKYTRKKSSDSPSGESKKTEEGESGGA